MDEFLDLPQHILEFATTEEHNKQEISVVGRGGCGLSINMKYVGKGINAVENSGYFPACSAVVMLKIEARSVCTRMRGCSSTPTRNKSKKKVTSKLELGLNLAVNVDFWVCKDDFNKKKPEGKNVICCFSMTLKTVIFVLVQIQTLIFRKNRLYFCVYWVSKFEGLSSEW